MKNTSQELFDATRDQLFTVNGVSFVMKPVEGGAIDSYYMGETPVTQALWTAVMGTTIEKNRDRVERYFALKGQGDDYPMYYVNWHDCQKFIAKLNELTGKTFRMPTEEEWEYAARGGKKGGGHIYAGSDNLDEVAWYGKNSGGTSHPVKTKLPNELGIYDMSGNVWEWCGNNEPGGLYHLHGGGWDCEEQYCQVSSRPFDESTIRYSNIGFRIIL